MKHALFALLNLSLFIGFATAESADNGGTKLLRFPDVYENEVVFCYAGDLWKSTTDGSQVSRLTAHPGQELFPRFSPDGEWIAFTGQYDGDEQVYIMPSSGGQPKQLTYYPAKGPLPPRWGYDNQVYGWTPDGQSVLFRSLRDSDASGSKTALFTVDRDGGLPKKLPMPIAGAGDFSPNGSRMVYSPLFRDFRSWKRYEGGWAQDLYIFDLETYDAQNIAPSIRTERDPMWIGDSIYFVSDRDGTLNLFRYQIDTKEITQLTDSDQWDVRWASSDNWRYIVFELGGELTLYDTKNNKQKKLSIVVPHDGLAMRPSRYPVQDNVEEYGLSHDGKRALFVARGDLFTLPIEKGPTRNLTESSDAHDRLATWSPDGKTIAFISDRTGEEQVWLVPQDGSEKPHQLTDCFECRLTDLTWSPDSQHLTVVDSTGQLYTISIDHAKITPVAREEQGGGPGYAWSPCGQHLALTLKAESGMRSLYIWGLQDQKLRQVTNEYANEFSPSWSPDGDYLFYLADREFAPQFSSVEWNYAGNRQVGIFALALRTDVENLFAPESDEVSIDTDDPAEDSDEAKQSSEDQEAETDKDKDDNADKKKSAKTEITKIDFDGLADRVARVPVSAENYGNLSVTDKYLIYTKRGASFYGRESYCEPSIMVFDLEERKETAFIEDSGSYVLSQDGKKILVKQKGKYNIYSVATKADSPKTISLAGLYIDRVPSEEWAEIFDEVCRRYRDYFYVGNMHGYDWEAIGDQYRELLPYVAHRSDLNYLIAEMISELNVGHAYIAGGDYEIPPRPQVALPGARFEPDEATGRYRIAHIFKGQNHEPKYRAPLSDIGIDLQVGDYLLAIDSQQVTVSDNPYQLLQHKKDPVTLTVASEVDRNGDEPSFEKTRDVKYSPISSETDLIYLDWVMKNIEQVDKATGGRVGYIHIPDMGANGSYEFIKWFYPQIRKEGMIIDVRANGGGNISQWILERLDTKLLGTRFGRHNKTPTTYPRTVFHGDLVCLINQNSASDGDIFPYYFREAGLGPLIGMRTWGGVVGFSGTGPLLDGGQVVVPLSATNDTKGEYVIEGHGVDPDIEVENDPKSLLEGHDRQLERGIKEVLKQMKANPKKLPECPADPVKTRQPLDTEP